MPLITQTEDDRELSSSEVLSQLDRITRSKAFSGSPRLCRFLAWTVTQKLENGGEHIKQYAIGREVFDRREDFDPKVDSIVRTEAQRMRRKLREYYSDEGRSDPVQITFQPGSYVPSFQLSSPAAMQQFEDKPGLAVLQFENLTGDSRLDYFSRGITESIQERLAAVGDLKVVATLSSFRLSPMEDLAMIASRLGVNTVVQGDIAKADHRIRVHAKAVHAADSSYLWAGTFDRDLKDVFAVEDEIASSIATSLCRKILGAPASRNPAEPTPEAYDCYLHGQEAWRELTPAGYAKAADYFTRAIRIWPHYAQAYAALAEIYFWQIAFSLCPASELLEPARHMANEALRLDGDCAEAYSLLGALNSFFDWNWSEAEHLFRKGLELRPNYAQAYIQRAFARLQRGDFERSDGDIRQAGALDPLSQRPYRTRALYSHLRRDPGNAITAIERALSLGSELKYTLFLAGRVYLQAGQHERALELLQQSIEGESPALYRGVLVAAYAALGRKREAEDTLHALHVSSEHAFVSPTAFLYAYAGLKRTKAALDWLETAADQHYTGFVFLKLEPLFDGLRAEPRFRAALARMHLD